MLKPVAILLGSLLALAAHAEDIDIFAGVNRSASADPNLLILVDNGPGWNQSVGGTAKVELIKSAVTGMISALTDASARINIGLMLFNAAAPSGAGTDGAYVRFAIRPMSSAANRSALIATIAGLDAAADLAAESHYSMAIEEARRYFGGLPILMGTGTPAKLDRSVVSGSGASYASPVIPAGCQRNVILVIGNGPPSARDADLALPYVQALNDGRAPAVLALPAPYPAPALAASQQAAANWLDEHAAVLRRLPFPDSPAAATNVASILTYGIAIHDPRSASENTALAGSGRALIMNAAMQGGGKYFDVANGPALSQALESMLAEALAVNAVFASPALPASVSPLGSHLNQVYMGMFRPDASGSPRWAGNLKQYQLAYNSSTGVLDLVDARDRPALDPINGFVTPSAQSFWTTAQTTGPILPAGSATVDFFVNAPAGTGLTPQQRIDDAPDGEVVDKGGVAQRLRAQFLGNQAPRNVYTCPAAGCSPGASLAGSPSYALDTANVSCASHQSAFGLPASTCATELPLLIDWIRGADNTLPNNEAAAGPGGLGPSPVRASIHGDVLHSRPLVVNYGTPGVVAFYGANDGMLRAVRAGQPASGGGHELWAFVAPETFAKFKRLRDASPPLQWPSPSSGSPTATSSRPGATPKDYFFDGAVTNHEVRDAAGNVTTELIFVTARRGGSFVYAFDVTSPTLPRLLWRHASHDQTDPAFDDLALTFSGAKAARVAGYARPVVIFGGGYHGGYDPLGAPVGEDAEPAATCAPTATLGCGNRIFVLDAATGAIVKTFQANSGNGGNLARGVAADLALVDTQGTGIVDRAYAADTGGSLWRIDFDASGAANWKMFKVASAGTPSNPRKFLHAPDVVVTAKYAAVLIGSGDREKPLKPAGTDRFYMIKDKETAAVVSTATGSVASGWPIAADDTASDNVADVLQLDADALRRTLAVPANNGWFYALAPGEKVVNGALTAAGVVNFSTHQATPAAGNTCVAALGTAKSYTLKFNNGTPDRDRNNDGVVDASDASAAVAGGGLSPSPVGGFVTLNDQSTGSLATVPYLVGGGGSSGGGAGTISQSAPAVIDQKIKRSRKKTYWYLRAAP